MMWNLDLFRKDLCFAVLASGSAGNAAVVWSGGDALLIDCGLSARRVLERLAAVGVAAEHVRGVLVTHEHGDHIGGVSVLARRLGVPVFASAGTARALPERALLDLRSVRPGRSISVGPFSVDPFRIPHDTVEPLGFVVGLDGERVGFATDMGSVRDNVVEALRSCRAVLLEFNHDAHMLENGPYPPWLKARVGGTHGHLSNEDGALLLRRLKGSRVEHVVLGHLSRQNNRPELALSVARAALHDVASMQLSVADQDSAGPTIRLGGRPARAGEGSV